MPSEESSRIATLNSIKSVSEDKIEQYSQLNNLKLN